MIIAAKGAVAAGIPGGLPYQWVAAGAGGVLYTSSQNPTVTMTWTSRTSSFGATDINAIASNGRDLYVAVGASGKLATSSDGQSWTQQTSSFSTTAISAVAYGNGIWVAAQANGTKAAYSTNGTSWTGVTLPASTSQASGRFLAYGNGYFVIGGQAGNIMHSTNGSSWTNVASATTTIASGTTSMVADYSTASSLWMIGAENNTAANGIATASAPNGTWTAQSLASDPGATGAIQTVLSNTSTQVFISTRLAVVKAQYSTNSTSWSDGTLSDTALTFRGYAFGVDDANRLMLMPTATTDSTQYSTDGNSWSTATAAPATNIYALCHSAALVPSRNT